MYKVYIKKDCKIGDESKKHLKGFLDLCCDYLKLTKPFTLRLIGERESEGHTTAYYMPDICKVVIKTNNRSTVDILRSIAHELVHHKQFQNDELGDEVQDIGGHIEDEANAVAGQLIKIYCKTMDNKNVYDLKLTENTESKSIIKEDVGYERVYSDKTMIDNIIKDLDSNINKWFKMNKKTTKDINYFKNDKGINNLMIYLNDRKLKIHLTDKVENNYQGLFDPNLEPPTVYLKTKFDDDKLKYDKNILYHELQHYVDHITKYKDKNLDDFYVYTDDYTKYLSQPIEFNAYFTSLILPYLDKSKKYMNSFNDMIEYIYKNNKDFKKFYDKVDETYRKKIIRRAYNYYQKIMGKS